VVSHPLCPPYFLIGSGILPQASPTSTIEMRRRRDRVISSTSHDAEFEL
jgi:hypothetical protein